MVGPTLVIPVSVIVPNFNSGDFLRECVESINSTEMPGEIIIIDDGSDDGSWGVAQELGSKFSNLRLVLREYNGGAAAARYDGILLARYGWVCFIDADDFIEVGAIGSAYRKVLEDASDMCIFNMWRYDRGRSWPAIKLQSADFPKAGRDAVVETLGSWRIHPLGVARRQLYISAYKNFSEESLNADELLTRIVFAEASTVSYCDKKYYYRVNPESSTQKISVRQLSMLDSHVWLTRFCKLYPEVRSEKIERDAIHAAWHVWARRKDYAENAALFALRKFLPAFFRESHVSKWIWRSPKYLFALGFISVVVKLKDR